jgi:hypothetical protein
VGGHGGGARSARSDPIGQLASIAGTVGKELSRSLMLDGSGEAVVLVTRHGMSDDGTDEKQDERGHYRHDDEAGALGRVDPPFAGGAGWCSECVRQGRSVRRRSVRRRSVRRWARPGWRRRECLGRSRIRCGLRTGVVFRFRSCRVGHDVPLVRHCAPQLMGRVEFLLGFCRHSQQRHTNRFALSDLPRTVEA